MFEVFKSEEDSQYYWRLKSGNGAIVATGGEGYETEAGVIRALGTVKRLVLEAVGQRIQVVHEKQADQLEADGESPGATA
jgi:uncharacterized protein YegP (UPF0339 family)